MLCKLLLVALLAVACNPPAAPASAPAAQNTPAATAASDLAATPGSPIKVRIAVGPAGSLVYLPIDVAQALKFFDAEGLVVDLQVMPDSTQAEAALLSGSVMFSGGLFDDAVRAQPQGKDLTMIVSFTRYPAIVVMVRADLKDSIKSPADFKGRKIGVTAIGAVTHVLAATLAAKAGLKPDDYTVLPVGSGTMANAFENKDIDVGVNFDTFATQLLKSGGVVSLGDLRTPAGSEQYLGGEYQFTGMLVDAATIKRRPEIVQKMVNAVVKAMAYMRAHSARELADALPDDVTGKDKQAWIDAYGASLDTYAPDGRVSTAGAENAVAANRQFGTIKPGDRIDIEALYDNTFVDRVK